MQQHKWHKNNSKILKQSKNATETDYLPAT